MRKNRVAGPLIVLLEGGNRHSRAAVLKSRGYRVFTTEHVVEVCLRWSRGGCAALVIGPPTQLPSVATLCEWIKINFPQKPIIVLNDRHRGPLLRHIDVVVPTQPVTALLDNLQTLLPTSLTQHSGAMNFPGSSL